MGFEGLIVTDAMNMEGVALHFGQIRGLGQTLVAGSDIALMPVTMRSMADVAQLDQLIAIDQGADRDRHLPEADVDEKVDRIIHQDSTGSLRAPAVPARAAPRGHRIVGSPEHLATQAKISDKAVTLVRNESRTLPFKPDRRDESCCSARSATRLRPWQPAAGAGRRPGHQPGYGSLR